MTEIRKIIGLGGTNGSGKDTVGEILARDHGFLFIPVTQIMREECRARGLAPERKNLREISAEWRRTGGMGAPIDKAIEVFRATGGEYAGLVIASLRHPGESSRVHELGGEVWWIDADPRLRYERVVSGSRGRSHEDDKTFEEFMEEEQAEMFPAPGSEPTALHGDAVRQSADVTISNAASVAELAQQLDQIIDT